MASSDTFFDPEVLARIGRLELRARAVVEGTISGLHRSPYHGHSVEFVDHRQYVPGDDPRHIDWKVLGRADRIVFSSAGRSMLYFWTWRSDRFFKRIE